MRALPPLSRRARALRRVAAASAVAALALALLAAPSSFVRDAPPWLPWHGFNEDAPAEQLMRSLSAASSRGASAAVDAASWSLQPGAISAPFAEAPPRALDARAAAAAAVRGDALSPRDGAQVGALAAALARLPPFAGLVAAAAPSASDFGAAAMAAAAAAPLPPPPSPPPPRSAIDLVQGRLPTATRTPAAAEEEASSAATAIPQTSLA